jgi:hypothetical protein
VGRSAKLDAEVLSLLAEAIFAYIDELSADSVEGFAEAQAETEDQRRRRQRELVELLLRDPLADPVDLRVAAAAANWKLPRRAAALACEAADLVQIAHRVPVDSLVAELDEIGCVLLSDPDGPGRVAEVERVVAAIPAALGPAAEPVGLRESWSLAKACLLATRASALSADGFVRAEDHLAELLLFEGSTLASRIATQRLAPFAALTDKARERMRETALAYVRQRGNSVEMAAALHLHPQTVRYRIARLRELLGDQLDDPDARFELEIALRRRDAGASEHRPPPR